MEPPVAADHPEYNFFELFAGKQAVTKVMLQPQKYIDQLCRMCTQFFSNIV